MMTEPMQVVKNEAGIETERKLIIVCPCGEKKTHPSDYHK